MVDGEAKEERMLMGIIDRMTAMWKEAHRAVEIRYQALREWLATMTSVRVRWA